jgi:hypothetical protein
MTDKTEGKALMDATGHQSAVYPDSGSVFDRAEPESRDQSRSTEPVRYYSVYS